MGDMVGAIELTKGAIGVAFQFGTLMKKAGRVGDLLMCKVMVLC